MKIKFVLNLCRENQKSSRRLGRVHERRASVSELGGETCDV